MCTSLLISYTYQNNSESNSLLFAQREREKINDRKTYSFLSLHSARVFSQSEERAKRFRRDSEVAKTTLVDNRPVEMNFGKSRRTCRKLESAERVGKSHEWPRNVNEAPLTQFCLAPLHPPVFPPLTLSRGERER